VNGLQCRTLHDARSDKKDITNLRQHDRVLNRMGRITLSTFIFLFLVSGAVYLTLLYVPPWMAYRAMQEVILEQAGAAAVSSDEEIIDRIMATAQEWKVPITKDQIEITRTDTRMSISTQWDVTINLFGGQYRHVLHFAPSTKTMMVPPAR
jgi:hypothetical protein